MMQNIYNSKLNRNAGNDASSGIADIGKEEREIINIVAACKSHSGKLLEQPDGGQIPVMLTDYAVEEMQKTILAQRKRLAERRLQLRCYDREMIYRTRFGTFVPQKTLVFADGECMVGLLSKQFNTEIYYTRDGREVARLKDKRFSRYYILKEKGRDAVVSTVDEVAARTNIGGNRHCTNLRDLETGRKVYSALMIMCVLLLLPFFAGGDPCCVRVLSLR